MKRRMILMPVIMFAFIAVAITNAYVFAAEPQSPVLTIDGSRITWTSAGGPVQFIIFVDGVSRQTMGPYADSFDLQNLGLAGGTRYAVTVRADFHIGDGLMPVLVSQTSNVVYYDGARGTQELPPPYIRLVGGYYLEVVINWPTIPNLVRDLAYFTVYADGYQVTRLDMSDPNISGLDLSTIGLSPGLHYIYVTASVDGGYWQTSLPSNTIEYTAASPARQLPAPRLRADGTDIIIELDRQDLPRSVYNNIEYRIYIDGYAENEKVSGDFNISRFNLTPGSYRLLAVSTVWEDGWQDSRRSNEIKVTVPGELRIGSVTVSPSTITVGGNVTVTVTGLANVKRLEIITEGSGTSTVEHTDTNPGNNISRRITLNSVNIDTIEVVVYGENNATSRQTASVTVNPIQVAAPIAEIGPAFSENPIVLGNGTGVLLEWHAVAGNTYGYRLFRAASDTADGISVSDSPILLSPAYSGQRVVTFDANAQPGSSHWYYVREVKQAYPEILGAPGLRVRADIPAVSPARPIAQRGFILTIIGNPQMNSDNTWKYVDPASNTAPSIIQGRTMVPLRAVVEAMGGEVGWDDAERRIDLRLHGNHVQMRLGRRDVNVNGTTQSMDVVPQIVNGKTLIPARYVAEFLGASVDWVSRHNMVVIVYDRNKAFY